MSEQEHYHEVISLGQLLAKHRNQLHLSQEELAEAIGTTARSINRWEHDLVVPQRDFRKKLAQTLHIPANLLFGGMEAEYTGSFGREEPPLFHVPFRRNPYFIGRTHVLQEVRDALCATQSVALAQALSGFGGVGKTQVALEYAYRFQHHYQAIFWLWADTQESVFADLHLLAERLGLRIGKNTTNSQTLDAFKIWLAQHEDWLLIFDNVEDLFLLRSFLPLGTKGHILLTTQQHATSVLANCIDLHPFSPEEGALFLLRRAKVLPYDGFLEQAGKQEQRLAREITVALSGLPLALDQAGAYLEETGCRFADYLHRYEQQRASLLDRRGQAGGGHPHSVTATIRLASQRVAQMCPTAVDLLRICTFLAAEGIPEEIFIASASCPAFSGDSGITDLYQLDQMIAALHTCSLIQRHTETRTLSIHQLVQAVLQDEMSEQERAQGREWVLRRLHALFPEVRHASTREQCERLLPHLLACLATFPEHEANHTLAEVFAKTASYLLEQEQHEQSKHFYQRVLLILKQEGDGGSLLLAKTLHDLALLYNRQGKPEQARPLYKQALCLREQLLGPDHPLVATSLTGLAIHHHEQGEDEQAEALYQRALRIREQALGPEHPLVSLSLNNLAELCFWQGKYEQAERLYRRALDILVATSGPNEPQLWYALDGLAALCLAQEKHDEAEGLYRQALSFVEQENGPHHLYVAFPLHGIATLACRRGDYKEAHRLYQRALALREQYLGPQNPETAQTLNGLAHLCMLQGKDAQAEQFYTQVLRIPPQHLRQFHPERARSLLGLARLSRKQGRDRQARSHFQQALTIFEQSLGAAHPETLCVKGDAVLFSAQKCKFQN